jgi:hypothetical protein
MQAFSSRHFFACLLRRLLSILRDRYFRGL